MKAAVLAGALILGTIGVAASEPGPVPANTSRLCQTAIESAESAPVAFSRVHPLDTSLAAALRAGVQRSQTLASLVARIEELDGIVYLFPGAIRRLDRNIYLRGGLSHDVKTTQSLRIIRIQVEQGRGDLTIATIGHELRHAVEVLEAPDAVDLQSVDELYRRIGFEVRSGIYETTAAHTAENRVFDELRQCR